jgi:hypothetical protein
MGLRARVTVNAGELVPDLVAALAAADCLVRRLDRTNCSVTVLDADEPEAALVELRFFLRAWTATRPGASALASASL